MDVMTPAETSTDAPNVCFRDLIKFSLALPCDDCLKKSVQVFGGIAAAISLFGDAAFSIRFLTDSSSLSKPFLSEVDVDDSFRIDWLVCCVVSSTVERRWMSLLLS